jgi:hypothetical protein
MVFLSTDAGGVGLNLQSGSVVINMDIPWNPAVLEQRIGRVHRLGQRKTVRIVNFVTESSIEERILVLLKFKKSLFAGALDREGDDVVMLGGSLLKRLMQSVETITAGLDKADVKGAQPARSEPEMGDKGAGGGDGNGRKALSDLVTAGAQLLTDLGRTLSRPAPSGGNPIDDLLKSLIHRDGKTDTSYLKIPLPEKEVVTNLFSAFVEIVAGAMGTKIARPR